MLLTCQPHNYSHLLESQANAAPLRTVKEAEAYLLAHAAEPVTITQVANALDVSIRSLDRAFHRHRGHGPKTFLQYVRLDRARSRLMAPRSADRVTNIAMDCGFGHIGRFSAFYRRRFGEFPAKTLARHTADF
jgi:transcriptional regulator GlxA family with amidase domain